MRHENSTNGLLHTYHDYPIRFRQFKRSIPECFDMAHFFAQVHHSQYSNTQTNRNPSIRLQ
jgi:hypothetical protein